MSGSHLHNATAPLGEDHALFMEAYTGLAAAIQNDPAAVVEELRRFMAKHPRSAARLREHGQKQLLTQKSTSEKATSPPSHLPHPAHIVQQLREIEECEQLLKIAEERKVKHAIAFDDLPPRFELAAKFRVRPTPDMFLCGDVDVERGLFSYYLAGLPLPEVFESTIWKYYLQDGSKISCGCRDDVCFWVRQAFDETAQSAAADVVLRGNEAVGNYRPNYNIKTKDGRILGSMFIKSADYDSVDSVFDRSSELYHEVHTCLLELRRTCGIATPFVIVTSYTGWIICWHDYADEVAAATTIEEIKRASAAKKHAGADGTPRKLRVSKLMQPGTHHVVKVIRHLLVRLSHIATCEPSDYAWRLVTKDAAKIVPDGPKIADARLREMVPRDTKEFFLLKLLHCSYKSAVFLMGGENNSCCIVKTCKNPEFELRFWKKAYGPEVNVWMTTLNGRPALVMPYFIELTEHEFYSHGSLIKQHKAELAARDVPHDDIVCGNVVWADEKKDAVMFIDWDYTSQWRHMEEVTGVTNHFERDNRRRYDGPEDEITWW